MSKLVGKWNVLTTTPFGEAKSIWFIEKNNDKYTGTLTNDGIITPWEEIVIENDHFEMKVSMQLPFGLIDFVMVGEYDEENDLFEGIANMKMGKSRFKGKRAL